MPDAGPRARGGKAGAGRLLSGIGILLVLAAVLAALLANTGIPTAGQSPTGTLRAPPLLGGARLTASVRGPAALDEVARLHGKRIDAADALVARYEGGSTLWMSASRSGLGATALLWRMNRRMAGGAGPFSAPRAMEVHGRTVFATTGLGARHFYYQSGNTVLWLQAREDLAEAALQDLLIHYP